MSSQYKTDRRSVNNPLSQMEEFFDHLFAPVAKAASPTSEPTSESTSWHAPVAIWENDEHFHLEVELPGVANDDIDVTFDEGRLRVSAERSPVQNTAAHPGSDAQTNSVDPKSSESDDRKYLVNERRFGKMRRWFSLPKNVDVESIEAKMANGLLHITIGKHAEAKPRKIQVTGS